MGSRGLHCFYLLHAFAFAVEATQLSAKKKTDHQLVDCTKKTIVEHSSKESM